MKKILLLLIILIPFSIFSQEESKKEDKKKPNARSGATYQSNKKPKTFKGSVTGKIIDLNTNKSLSYTNVSIVDEITNKSIEGTITSENGKFSFKEIESGKYKLIISFLGYKTKEIPFELTPQNPDYKFKKIKLEPSSQEIQTVEVNAKKAIYENKIDKIVYNPENDINQSSDDASDVLRKTPLLSVDFDGNVSLRGSKNIKFLLNGKTSMFLSKDVGSALQMISADEIKSVEVITSPGAKYDGEGDAGIVNIITKKKILDGHKGTLSGSVGTRANRQSLNLTLGKGRFGLSARGGAHYSWPRGGATEYKRQDWDNIINVDTINKNILTRKGESFSQWIGFRGGIDMFYEINAYQTITSGVSISGNRSWSENVDTVKYYQDDILNYEYIAHDTSKGTTSDIEWTTDYTKRFANNEERELSIALQIGREIDNEETNVHEDNSWTQNYSVGNGTETTFQIDYTHPLGSSSNTDKKNDIREKIMSKKHGFSGRKKGNDINSNSSNKIEIGAKVINRDNSFTYNTNSDRSSYIFEKETFDYNQIVASSYLSSQFQFRGIGLVLGSRIEYTKIKGLWERNLQNNFDRDGYWSFLPNAVISTKLSETKSLKLSYNRRITRPGRYYINPNVSRNDNKNITEGNPYLDPSISDQIEFGYTSFGKIYQGSYFIYYKHTKDIIESNLEIVDDISKTTFLNIGQSDKYGINYYGSIMLSRLNLRGGFNVFSYNAKGNVNGESLSVNNIILYNYNIGGTVDLGRNIKFETWGWFSSPTQTLQGSSTTFSMMSFGIKKDFKNKRGSLGIRVIQPFSKYKDFESNLSGDNFTQYSNNQVLFRSYGLSFSYTFGKLNFTSKNAKTKIKNDDLKQEESQQQ